MAGKGLKNCAVASHQDLKDQAKNRVQDLLSIHNQLQLARKESRAGDVVKLEERVNEVLREWKAELDEPSPTSSFLEESLGSFAEQLGSLLQHFDVEDDATSPLSKPPPFMNLGNHYEQTIGHSTHGPAESVPAGIKEVYYSNHTRQHDLQSFETNGGNFAPDLHGFQDFGNHLPSHLPQQHEFQGCENQTPQQHVFQGFEHRNGTHMLHGTMVNDFEAAAPNNLSGNNSHTGTQLDYLEPNVHENFGNEIFFSEHGFELSDLDIPEFTAVLPDVNPPPSAFLGPKCALWDCARPAQGSELCNNYCSSFHADLAVKECPPGSSPVLRPGGIGLKDGPLIMALRLKVEGNAVGIPECPGAATAKSPWNAPELFDISILKGEKIREWLFFDKPRRAFETGNRKQRSLPDHVGRGWHESRKQMMNEYGGRKRSYYADPQPQENFEWHLFEYEINKCDVFALYRLELKVAEEKKKSPKTKVPSDPVVDLQNRMGRLTAVVSTEDKPFGMGKTNGNLQPGIQITHVPACNANEVNVQLPGGQSQMHYTGDRKDS